MRKFVHDCKSCIFIGNWKTYDVYTHFGDITISIILRYGNEPVDNKSYPIFGS